MHKYNEVLLNRNAREIRRRLQNIVEQIEGIPEGDENSCFNVMQIVGTNINVIRGIHSQNKGIKMADKNAAGD